MSVNADQVLDDANKGVLADSALADDSDSQQDSNVDSGDSEIDYEKEALDNGWNPSYDGPNKKTAKQFVEDGKNILPIVQSARKKAEARADALEAELRETKANTQKSIQALEKQFQRETERKIAEIKAGKEKAVANADIDAFKKLEAEEAELLKAPEPEKTVPDYKSDPVIQAWESENPWYGTDKDLTDYADWYAEKRVSGTGKKGKEYLEAVAEGVKKQFPGKFKNPRKDNFSGAAPSSRQQPGKTTSFDTLPASAKRDFDYAVTRGLIKDTSENRQQFAKDFSEAE